MKLYTEIKNHKFSEVFELNKDNKEKSTTADDISPDVTIVSIFICLF